MTLKRLVRILLCAALLLGLLSVTAFAGEGDVAINETNFPDAVFRQYVSDSFDTSPKDGVLSASESANVTLVYVTSKNISSLKGIEFFSNLSAIYCSFNQLTELDISNNIALQHLYCSNNSLSSLNVSNNTELKALNCQSNNLDSLDVSKNTKLTSLSCHFNALTSLDVSKNTLLETLFCYNNQLTELNVDNNLDLINLDCSYNQLSALDVNNNTKLEQLFCNSNELSSLNVSKNTKLTRLDCYMNNLTTLDVSNNPALSVLCSGDNQLTSLDLRYNTTLQNLYNPGNYYTITIPSTTRTFDLTTLPGNFDVSKASNWNGGTVSGNTLTVDNNIDLVTYSYNCGNNFDSIFNLRVTVHYHFFDQNFVKDDALKTPADCTNDAIYYKSCSCGEIGAEETFTDVGSALDHDHSGEWQYEDKTGHWRICARTDCDERLDEASHTYGDWVETVPATETEEGQKERTCSACDYTDTAVIPKLEHTHSFSGDWEKDMEKHWHECIAGDGERSEEAAHIFGDWVETIPPTGTEKGQKEHTCTICDYTETEELPAKRVVFIEPDESNAPTDANQNTDESDNPSTGDNANLPLLTVLLLVSGVGMISTVVYGRRRTSK